MKKMKKNYDLMKKYYLTAINKGNSIAMCNLGIYYENIEKNYDLMKKYYLMAIDNENTNAMIMLANYYKTINYDLMKKYYLMAINNGTTGEENLDVMNNLTYYYEKSEMMK